MHKNLQINGSVSHEKVRRSIAYEANVGVTLYGVAAHGTLLSFYCDAIFVEYKMVAL